MREFHGPGTRVVDAAGGTVLPGFIESHMHLFGGSAELDQLTSALTEAARQALSPA